MQVILLETIQKVGSLGDLAHVKAGYARNFLIPQGKAKPATKANLAEFETLKADLEAKEALALKNAQAIETKMTDLTLTLDVNASDEGKLFGSISNANINQGLADLGFEIDKRNINMPEAIRYTGEYQISVTLHTYIMVNIKVIVVKAAESS